MSLIKKTTIFDLIIQGQVLDMIVQKNLELEIIPGIQSEILITNYVFSRMKVYNNDVKPAAYLTSVLCLKKAFPMAHILMKSCEQEKKNININIYIFY